MTMTKGITVFISWLEIITLPMMLAAATGIDWTWQLAASLLMSLALALSGAKWQRPLVLTAALVCGLLASVGQWVLLPLMVAQVVGAALLCTQPMAEKWRQSGWLLVVFFSQAALMRQLMYSLQPAQLGMMALLLVPLAISIWAAQMPLWLGVVALVAVAFLGYFLQQFTWVAAVAAVIIPAAVSSRVLKVQALSTNFAGVLLAVIFCLTRIHG